METAIGEVHKLLRTGGVPTSLALSFRLWLTVSFGLTGRSAGTSYSQVSDPSFPLSLTCPTVSVDVKHHAYLLTYSNLCYGIPHPKFQALVYDILPSTTAVFSYAIGYRKLSAKEQFLVGAQTVVIKFVTNNSAYIRRLFYNGPCCLRQLR